jgi:hypothetical protein
MITIFTTVPAIQVKPVHPVAGSADLLSHLTQLFSLYALPTVVTVSNDTRSSCPALDRYILPFVIAGCAFTKICVSAGDTLDVVVVR